MELDELEVKENPAGGEEERAYSKEELTFEHGPSTRTSYGRDD